MIRIVIEASEKELKKILPELKVRQKRGLITISEKDNTANLKYEIKRLKDEVKKLKKSE